MTKTNSKTPNSDLKTGLILWADKHGVTPADFAKAMEYQYPSAWDILRGKRDFTKEALGRFTLAYGTDSTAELLKLAGIEPAASSQNNTASTHPKSDKK